MITKLGSTAIQRAIMRAKPEDRIKFIRGITLELNNKSDKIFKDLGYTEQMRPLGMLKRKPAGFDYTDFNKKKIYLADNRYPRIPEKEHFAYIGADTTEKREYIQALLRRHEAAEAKHFEALRKNNPKVADYVLENNKSMHSTGKPANIPYPTNVPEYNSGGFLLNGTPVGGHVDHRVLTDVDFDNLFIKNYFPEITDNLRKVRTLQTGEIPTMLELAGEKTIPLSKNYSKKIMSKLRALKGTEMYPTEAPGFRTFNVTRNKNAYEPIISELQNIR